MQEILSTVVVDAAVQDNNGGIFNAETQEFMTDSPKPEPKVKPVRFEHEKVSTFRTYHADGSWSIRNAQQLLNVHFFVECPKMAETVIQPISSDGRNWGEAQMIGAGEQDPQFYVIKREMQCSVVLSVSGAMVLRQQLDEYIQAFEQQTKEFLSAQKETTPKEGSGA